MLLARGHAATAVPTPSAGPREGLTGHLSRRLQSSLLCYKADLTHLEPSAWFSKISAQTTQDFGSPSPSL